MNYTHVYIGDRIVDLKPGQIVSTTIKKLAIGDFTKRSVNYTNQLKAVWSESNCLAFGFSYNELSTSTKPYRLLQCKIVQNGIETIGRGVAYITDADQQYVYFNILEDVFDFFNSIDGLTLDTIQPIADSGWNGAARDSVRATTSGIIAAVINWGRGIYNEDFFLPSFYYHTLVSAVLEYTGLTVSGDILTDARFKELVMPFPGASFDAPLSVSADSPSFVDKGIFDAGAATSSVSPLLPSSLVNNDILFLFVLYEGTGITVDPITGWTGISLGTFKDNGLSVTGGGNLYYRFVDGTESAPTVTITGGPATQLGAIIYQFRGDGTNLTFESGLIYDTGDGDTTITWPAVTVSGNKRTLVAIVGQIGNYDPGTPTGYTNNASDTWGFGSEANLECSSLPDQITGASVTASGGSILGWVTFHVSIYNNAPDSINWNQYLSDLTASDLLKDFFMRFCLVHKLVGNTLYLKTLESILTDRVNVIDWSTKLVNRPDESINFTTPYGQNNYLLYRDSEEVGDPTLGQGNLTIDNTTLPYKVDLYTSVFGNSKTLTYGTYLAANIPVFTADSADIEDFQNPPGIRLLTLKDRTTENAITFNTTSRTDFKVGYFVDAAKTKDTGFQYFIDQFYPSLESALQRNKVITKYFNLDELDIAQYDPFKMMYDGVGYYIVNQINFIPGKITKVELFKVAGQNNTVYEEPFDFSYDFTTDFDS